VLLLLAMVLVGTLFEIMGIGLIIPVIMVIMDPSFVDTYPEVVRLLSYVIDPTYNNIMAVSIVSLCLFYMVKTLYLLILAHRQGVVIYDVKEEVGRRLFTGYMFKPYEFYLLNNSAELIRNLTSEVGNLGVVLRAGMVLVVDGIVLLSVVALLVYVEPLGSLTIFLILSFSAIAFQHLTKDRLIKYGKSRQFNEGKRIQHIQQGLSSVKDVKVLGREKVFIEWFVKHNSAGIRAERFQYVMGSMPRLFLEFTVVLGLAALISVQILSEKSMESISLVLGVYAVAIFRLLPSVNRILAATQQIRFCFPSVKVIAHELEIVKDNNVNSVEEVSGKCGMPTQDLLVKIAVENLSFRHFGADRDVLENVKLEIKVGEFIGIVGGSGAGKSTLVDIILGLLDPTAGYISVDGKNIEDDLRGWQQQIGYVPQHIYLTDDSIRKNIAFGVKDALINDIDIDRAIHAAQLSDLMNSLPENIETLIGEHGVRLSGGQRQRIGIARALYHNPKILILDEATSALDHDTESEIMSTIDALHGQKTIILVTHRLATLSNCDRVYRIENGGVIGEENPNKLTK
jgi:ATP-binding cassette, subfamily B, bacterial PglK